MTIDPEAFDIFSSYSIIYTFEETLGDLVRLCGKNEIYITDGSVSDSCQRQKNKNKVKIYFLTKPIAGLPWDDGKSRFQREKSIQVEQLTFFQVAWLIK